MGDIYIKDLVMKYNDAPVIDHISEHIQDGELYAFLGASGSGKTTLLKLIAGLQDADSGVVEVNGNNIMKFNKKQMLEYHKNSGFVFQNAALISNMSIYENLSLYYNYHTDMKDKEIYEKIKKYLDYFEFDNDLTLRPASLSMGERMVINIIRAISHEPEYIFWDNPATALDIHYQRKVKNIIMDLKKERRTMILSTGDFGFAASIADRIGVMYRGRIIEYGTPEEIKNSNLEITKNLIG